MTTIKYESPKRLKEILEQEFNLDFESLTDRIMKCTVAIKTSEIKYYLENRLQNEYPDVYKRNEERKKRVYPTISILDKEHDDYLGISEKNDKDKAITKKYTFDEDRYELYKKYVDKYRRKCILLCNIIIYLNMNIKNNEILSSYVANLDITFDKNDILEEDINRLIRPIIYNIRKLFTLSDEANSFIAYYNNSGSINEEEYPSSEIQSFEHKEGYIDLTDKQKLEFINRQYKKSF